MATTSEELALAVQHHKAGRLQAAEQIYRKVLEIEPHHSEALHLLGLIAHQVGNHESAIELIEAAIRWNGTKADFHSNLGEAYRSVGRFTQAIACYQRTLQLNPDAAGTHANLGVAFKQQGQLPEAAACYRKAVQLRPDFAESYHNLGKVLQAQGQYAEALACYQKAVELAPNYFQALFSLGNALKAGGRLAEAITRYLQALQLRSDDADVYNNLGIALNDQGKLAEAISCYQQALQLKPDFAEAHNNLGNVLGCQGHLAEAAASYQRALLLKPDFAEAHNNLGNALNDHGRLAEAIACYTRALELKPDSAGTCLNLGNALKDLGQLPEAISCYQRALEIEPNYAKAHSNLVYALNFCADYDAEAIYEEARRWSQRHAAPLARFIRPHPNDRAPDRRLRIGYVSPDFAVHPVGRFLLPLLQAHDHDNVETFCYASVRRADKLTESCRAHAGVWRPALGLSDEQLDQTIREDRIDILVDLTMHMADNRLMVFARKPAPVQATYLAYCGTTGLDTMDYRLTDPYLDPPGQDERFYAEKSIPLPETYWCYRPPIETPKVNPLPALEARHVTFGCLNNFCKVSEPTLLAWSRLLQALPEARLLLRAKAGSNREQVHDFFAHHGIAPERLTFVDKVSLIDYFKIYQRMDVALDPFPYGGGTTTCDALWMGVPVLTLAGKTAVGRGGLSILSNLGLADLVANDTDQFVHLGVNLAGDLPRLTNLRATLRQRMQASPLMDAPRFARHVEAAYREMWRRWCGKKE